MRNIKDIDHVYEQDLPAAAGTTYGADITLSTVTDSPASEVPEDLEMEVEIPAMTVGELPDAATVSVAIYAGSAAAPTAKAIDVITVTGAGGAGAAATSKRFRLPSNVGSIIRTGIVGVGNGDVSAKNITFNLLF